MSEPLVSASEVTFRREARDILGGVSVHVSCGEVVAVVGPSGSGKSSLLALLAGLEQPDSGAVRHTVPAHRIGLVLQGYGLVNLLSAAENVEIALQARAVSRSRVRDAAAAALASVSLDHLGDRLVEELSGGQQQRVAVARALAIEPALLIADEITAELDAATRDQVAELVFARAAAGTAVVIATHDPLLAARCDRVIRLVDGRVAA